MYYQYDGSFPGFLSVVYQAYHDGTSHVEKIENKRAGSSLFGNEKIITSNIDHASSVINSFHQKCGSIAAHTLYYAFMAEQPEREMILFYYICTAFRHIGTLSVCRRDPWIQQVEKWSLKTSNECQRILGLLRFNELAAGMLYAIIKPDYNIVPLIAGHFTNRLPAEEWAIHDIHRHIAAYYDKKTLLITEITEPKHNLDYSKDEQKFRQMWCQYYRSIAIKERENPRLRRSFMPEKYWPYLTEMTADQTLQN
ncbi:TIGR03915 family putative DNA repair protein [Pectinatus frisingensis]|jgi:probable DNA metabolism protein|uniref:TIGR03915 family putative DNA repair protein n=1 Tax=Pectinatus frisingensis TaxID=865 RepID=UPI0015F38ED8|nr:TIGR03915 family putative DNA repair protein [Pectinatus frisingensis]